MSRSPLERMIDDACSCVKCGQKGAAGNCGCWILIECPKCGKSKWIDRDEHDPPKAVKVHVQCPDCNAGDFDEPKHFDASGRHILFGES